jgi:predicted PurR-regulated permease PerM
MAFPPPSERQARWVWFSVTGLAVGVLVGLLVLLVWVLRWVLQQLSPVLLPLAAAAVVAYLLDPVVDFFARRGIRRVRAVLLVFGAAIAVALTVSAIIFPRLYLETRELWERAPAYATDAQVSIQRWVDESPKARRLFRSLLHEHGKTPPVTSVTVSTNESEIVVPLTPGRGQIVVTTDSTADFDKLRSRIIERASAILPIAGRWFLEQLKWLTSLAALFLGLALIPVYVFYFLQEKEGIQRDWTDYLPLPNSRLKTEIVFVLSSINDCMIVFFRGQVLVALCSGTLLTIGFLILGVKYAVLLGLLSGLLGIVPYLGVVIGIVPSVLLAAVQFRDGWHPLGVVALFGIVNLLEGFVISPKIIGDRVGLHPLSIIVALMVGTTLLGGLLGGLVAIPLTAALRAVLFRYVWTNKSVGKSTPSNVGVLEESRAASG